MSSPDADLLGLSSFDTKPSKSTTNSARNMSEEKDRPASINSSGRHRSPGASGAAAKATIMKRKKDEEKSQGSSEDKLATSTKSLHKPSATSNNKPSTTKQSLNISSRSGSRHGKPLRAKVPSRTMRQSILLFEEKLNHRLSGGKEKMKGLRDSKGRSGEEDKEGHRRNKTLVANEEERPQMSRHRRNQSKESGEKLTRSLSRPRKGEDTTNTEATTANNPKTDRKLLAKSVGVNSNPVKRRVRRPQDKELTTEGHTKKQSSSGNILSRSFSKRGRRPTSEENATPTGSSTKKTVRSPTTIQETEKSSKANKENPTSSSSTKKTATSKHPLSRSTGPKPDESIFTKMNSGGTNTMGSRKNSVDDLSLLMKRKHHTRNNSFNGNESANDLLKELKKEYNCGNSKLDKDRKDGKERSQSRDRKEKDTNSSSNNKPERKAEGRDRSYSKTTSSIERRFSDEMNKQKSLPSAGGPRRASMDEATLELFSSTRLIPLKKTGSMASINKSERSTGSGSHVGRKERNSKGKKNLNISENSDDSDMVFAMTAWGGQKGKNASKNGNLKKSLTSSDGGLSLNKSKTATAGEDKKVKRSVVATSTAGVKKSMRKSKKSVETAAPVATTPVIAREKKGVRISRVTLCAVFILYIISLALVGVLGFWLHMVIFPEEDNAQIIFSNGGDGANDKAVLEEDEGSKVSLSVALDTPTFSPSTGAPSITAMPTTETRAPIPSRPSKQQTADIKNPPADSIIPTISSYPTTSSSPSTLSPTNTPSFTPTTSIPTFSPSTTEPTLSRNPSSIPSLSPSISSAPSSTPTGIPRCPEELQRTADLGPKSLITMRYEIIPLPLSDPHGGLFCVSIEYPGNAGWIGFAVSGASRDPAFGRKEAIIGIPGVSTLVAVAGPGREVAVGQQVGTAVIDGPVLINPGKYEIPAGELSLKMWCIVVS